MPYPTDIEIAQACEMQPISKIAARAGICDEYLEPYGKYKAKIDPALLRECPGEDGKLILVTAITPTPAGEGKTTTTIGLADGLSRIGKNVVVALREPSLGPVFGIKGGAAGGGYAQVVPMEDINLHFTGDFHAIGAANNLLAAMLDNHIQQGNALHIDPRRITWKRCVDMNDRQLRFVVDGLGGKANGTPREPDRSGLQLRGRACHRWRSEGCGRHDRPFKGRAEAQPGPDSGGHPRLRPRRPLCQHRPRLQLRHGHPYGAEAG